MKFFQAKSAIATTFLTPNSVNRHLRQMERREWLLWGSALSVTLLLTLALVSFLAPMGHHLDDYEVLAVHPAIRALVSLVLLFDIYTIYLQYQIARIRRQVLEQERLFRLITENAGDMIAVVDIGGRRLYNSPSYEKVLGYSPEELHNSTSLEQIHPSDQPLVQDAVDEARRTGFGRRIEYRMRHKDGTWRYLESTASAIRSEAGQVEKLVIVNRDITSRRRLEEQFRQSQKMEAVGRLSGGIAHDFNNLLGVIIGYGEILVEKFAKTDPAHESVDEILKAGKRAASLTRQLLAFSRQQVLEPKALNLNEIVSETEKMLRRLVGEDIEFVTNLSESLGTVKADPGQIEQVLMNLVVNARDAMPEGGKLLIETTNIEVDESLVQRYSFVFKTGSYVLLSVTDTGIGIDPEMQPHIFEPFFTTKGKDVGTGLGLATVYGVVKQSGGYIEVVSELGQGTTFKIYLPKLDETPQLAPEPAKFIDNLRGQETILVVEDEASLRNLTCNVLRSLGYRILSAATGLDALEIGATNSGIKLLLTDVVMPGVNGPALAQKLRERNPNLRVIYMSGYTGQGVGNHGTEHPNGWFLAKPFTQDLLAYKVRAALDSHAPVVAW